jgi:hypothetical protein
MPQDEIGYAIKASALALVARNPQHVELADQVADGY